MIVRGNIGRQLVQDLHILHAMPKWWNVSYICKLILKLFYHVLIPMNCIWHTINILRIITKNKGMKFLCYMSGYMLANADAHHMALSGSIARRDALSKLKTYIQYLFEVILMQYTSISKFCFFLTDPITWYDAAMIWGHFSILYRIWSDSCINISKHIN